MQSRTIIRTLSLATILVAAPLTVRSGQGIVANRACSQTEVETGTCCSEAFSICNAGTNTWVGYYYKTSGRCHTGG
jgi:hypothetical protein